MSDRRKALRYAPLSRAEAKRLKQASQLETYVAQRQLRTALRSALNKYVDRERQQLQCQHCGVGPEMTVIVGVVPDDTRAPMRRYLVYACATIEQITRCVPLCHPCHSREHRRMRAAAETIDELLAPAPVRQVTDGGAK